MTQRETDGLRTLVADYGYKLIKKDMDINSICDKVYLGNGDKAANWAEVTDAEAKAMTIAAQKEEPEEKKEEI